MKEQELEQLFVEYDTILWQLQAKMTAQQMAPSETGHAVEKSCDEQAASKKQVCVNRWSEEETHALQQGLKDVGRGQWQAIIDAHRTALARRTGRDLKDKYTQMGKSVDKIVDQLNALPEAVQRKIARAFPRSPAHAASSAPAQPPPPAA